MTGFEADGAIEDEADGVTHGEGKVRPRMRLMVSLMMSLMV